MGNKILKPLPGPPISIKDPTRYSDTPKTILGLPPDIIRLIAYKLDPRTVEKLCRAHPNFYNPIMKHAEIKTVWLKQMRETIIIEQHIRSENKAQMKAKQVSDDLLYRRIRQI